MIFETVTTIIMGAIGVHAHLSQRGGGNDSKKIQKIFTLSGLNVKDGTQTLTPQLVRKRDHSWGAEYKYRLPLGRSFEDVEAKRKTLEAGLNSKTKVKLNLRDLSGLKLDKNFISNVQNLFKKKLTSRKEIELVDDGLLIIRVYNEPLPKEVTWEAGTEWKVLAGQTREKNAQEYIDFEKTPHFALGGATRYGKSNFINSIMCSLLTSKPDDVVFHLVDLKGGVELCDYESIKQTAGIAYEPEEALEVLKGAYDEMRRTQEVVRKSGHKNVQQAGITKRHFIIIDEVGELNPDEAVDKKDIRKDGLLVHKSEKTIKLECQMYMSKIARLGAGLGFRLVLATQYPTGDVIPRQCKQNSDVKMCFRVQNSIASRVVLDSEGAEVLPEIRGRAILQRVDKRIILQTPLVNSQVIRQATEKYIITKEAKTDGTNKTQEEATDREGGEDFTIFEETRLS
jgi:DNA segregation ATPase FtsK/SpoIIIE, S-DNA-T family